MLKIYFTSDLHNRKNVFKFLKALGLSSEALLLDSGDAIGGNNFFGSKQEFILHMMNDAGYGAMALGNREFNYFRKILTRRLKQVSFPILACNLKDLKGITSSFLKPYIVEKLGDFKVAIIGLTPNQFSKSSLWTKVSGFEFEDYFGSVKKCIDSLRQGVNLIVILSHIGLRDDMALAEKLDEEVIILGGHSHKFLKEPIRINKSLIFHVGCHGKYIGEISFEVKNKKLIFSGYNLVFSVNS